MPPSGKTARVLEHDLALWEAKRSLRRLANLRKAHVHRGFFKETDDVFLGVTTPQIRQLVRQFQDLPLAALHVLMKSHILDERSLAHAILVRKFERGDASAQERIFHFYIRNRQCIRSWDGVDDSAPYIAGRYLLNRKQGQPTP